MKKIFTVLAAAVAALVLLSGCKKTEFSTKATFFFCMDTEADLVISDRFDGAKTRKFKDMCAEIDGVLTGLNNSLSISVEASCVSRFNAAQAGEEIETDKNAYEVLSLAKKVYTDTDGYYNPAVYYSVYDYGFYGLSGVMTAESLPSSEKTEKYAYLASRFGEAELSARDGKYYVTKPDVTVDIDGAAYSMKIDLGGIGKGYAADKVNDIIDGYGFKYGYFSFGSSSILCKEHYANGDYTLAFNNPRPVQYGQTYFSTAVRNECISTSGDYVQYYEIDGVRYCHVIDPVTCSPVRTGIMSATVIGGNAAEADALTTAIMAMGREKASSYIKKLTDVRVAFAYDNEGSYEVYTNMPAGGFTLTDERFTAAAGE